MYDLLIIGGGPAGLSAAMTARNRNLSVCVICGGAADSALHKAGRVTNYPGVPDVSGPALLETMTQQARDLGADMLRERALSAMPMGKTFGVSAGKEFVEGRALLLATGIAQRGTFPGETDYLGRGVSYCATCDAFFYRGKDVAVLGSGEYALHEAQALLPVAKSVTLLANGQPLTAEFPAEVAVRPEKVEAILGEQRVSGVQLAGGETVALDGVFVALGVAGSTALARKLGAEVDGNRIVTDEHMMTTLPGLYAAGDCTGGLLQVAKAVYEGALAGSEAAKALRKG